MALHTISTEADWRALSRQGLTTVVDPMVVRCGEFFLKGAAGVAEAGQVWPLLEKNIHSVGMFFDAIILQDRIPVFNYGDTYDMGLNFEQRTINAVNRDELVLVDVDVQYQAYKTVKDEVLAKLKELYSGPPRIKPDLARDITGELAAAEYRWQPHLGELQAVLPSDTERALAQFLLGGMIFAAYAQILEGEHVLQPKRSRLLLAVELGAETAQYRFEEELFAELKTRARASVTDLPWRPTFFPYLLAHADTPEAVLAHALALRASSEVIEYRAWLQSALRRWSTDGEIDTYSKDVNAIAKAIDRITGKVPVAPKVEFKITVADVAKAAAGQPFGPGVDLTPAVQGIWGWLFPNLPGKRYRKILARAIAADAQYKLLENRLKTVWGFRASDVRGGH
jgi:hypothetical protein